MLSATNSPKQRNFPVFLRFLCRSNVMPRSMCTIGVLMLFGQILLSRLQIVPGIHSYPQIAYLWVKASCIIHTPLPLQAGNLLLNQAQATPFLVHPHQGAAVLREQAGIVQQILLQASPQPPTLVGLPILLETTKRKVHPMSVPSSRLRTKNKFASFASTADATFEVFGFSCETGTSSLRAHLMKFICGQIRIYHPSWRSRIIGLKRR